MAFEKEIKEYEDLRRKYQTLIINKMEREEYIKYNEVLFSTHSCAIEGNSFSVDDTRELKEKGLGMIPAGKTLFEAFEMLDHFEAFEYMMQNSQHPLDENFLKEINRRVTSHTLSYRSPEAIPGEYTTTDMAAGDTVFGDHEELIARGPKLILADEPTGNLDSKNGAEVMHLLTELNHEGTTIVMVTHNEHDAKIAHRTIRLFDGQIVEEGNQ